MQELLPVIYSIVGDVLVCQPDNAPTHRAHDMVELLCRETPYVAIQHYWPKSSWLLYDVACLKFKLLYNMTTGCFKAIHFFWETI